MIQGVDIVGVWEMIVAFFDRVVAWLFCVIGGGDWDPDYGR